MCVFSPFFYLFLSVKVCIWKKKSELKCQEKNSEFFFFAKEENAHACMVVICPLFLI